MPEIPPLEPLSPAASRSVNYDALGARLGAASLSRRRARQDFFNGRVKEGPGGRLRVWRWVDKPVIAWWLLTFTGQLQRAKAEYFRFAVTEREVFLPKLPTALEGRRLLHIADVHADGHPELVPRLAAKLRELAPVDIVVNTGDYRAHCEGGFNASLSLMKLLSAEVKTPHFGVLGNHDVIEQVPELEAQGMRLLLNESVALTGPLEGLWLAGVDDAHEFRSHDLGRALAAVPGDACVLLLSHAPETFREAAERGVSLQLSGHTHGGQIALPGGIPLYLNSRAPRWTAQGLWCYRNLVGYTSRGLGGVPPLRLNCPPEIVVLTLRRGPVERNGVRVHL